MTCHRCGSPMREEIGLSCEARLQAIATCRCGSVESLGVRLTWAEVRRRIAIVKRGVGDGN